MTEDKIIELYESGYSIPKISSVCGYTNGKIWCILKKNNVQMRSNKQNSRKYFVNDCAFEKVDCSEKAYWLGFLSADGYVSSTNGKRVGVAISTKDYDHLVKFNSFLDSNYPIKQYSQHNEYGDSEYCRIIISSDKLYDDLTSMGIVEHKTPVLKFPKFDDKQLCWDYLRGYCDGDGCITKNGKSFALKFECCERFCDDLIQFLNKEIIDFKYSVTRRRPDCVSVSVNIFGKSAFSAIKNMYANSTIFLDRKMDAANRSMEYFSLIYQ